MSPIRARTISGTAAIVIAIAGCGEASEPHGSPAVENSTERASTLFLAGNEEMWVVDVVAERARHLRLPGQLAAGDPPHAIARIGDRLALWSYDVTGVPVSDPGAPPTTLAEDGWIFIPAANPERIWVGYVDPESPASERALGELREIDASGDVITRGVSPPDGAWPFAELRAGLLFQGPGPIRLWDPHTGRTVRTYPWEQIGDMGPVSGNLLASCLGSCDELILTDFAAGRQHRIAAPNGRAFAVAEAAFSPDGAMLAVPVKEAGGGWRSFSTYDRELALVSLATGETEVVAGVTVAPGYVFTAWSPDGAEVFITGGGPGRREIGAYRLGEPEARRLDVEVGDFYDVATG